MDSLGLSTAQDKLAAIALLKFLETLKDLKAYLGFTGWLWQYVSNCVVIVQPLQDHKTRLLRGSPTGNVRKHYVAMTRILDATPHEIRSFETLQELLKRPTYLVHFDLTRWLYIDLDSSKAFGFSAVLYHVKDESEEGYPKRSHIELIMFLSRMLGTTERNY